MVQAAVSAGSQPDVEHYMDRPDEFIDLVEEKMKFVLSRCSRGPLNEDGMRRYSVLYDVDEIEIQEIKGLGDVALAVAARHNWAECHEQLYQLAEQFRRSARREIVQSFQIVDDEAGEIEIDWTPVTRCTGTYYVEEECRHLKETIRQWRLQRTASAQESAETLTSNEIARRLRKNRRARERMQKVLDDALRGKRPKDIASIHRIGRSTVSEILGQVRADFPGYLPN